jgi:hypothetical protein
MTGAIAVERSPARADLMAVYCLNIRACAWRRISNGTHQPQLMLDGSARSPSPASMQAPHLVSIAGIERSSYSQMLRPTLVWRCRYYPTRGFAAAIWTFRSIVSWFALVVVLQGC